MTARSELIAQILAERPDLTERQAEHMIAECREHGAFRPFRRIDGVQIGNCCPECWKQDRTERLIHDADIPTRFLTATFDSWNARDRTQTALKASVHTWITHECGKAATGAFIAFIGKPGTGKTHLAIAAIREAIEKHNRSAQYVTTREVIRRVRDTWRRDSSKSEQDVIDDLVGVRILVIDEIGVQSGSENEKAILFDLLDARYREMRATLLISNEDLAGLTHYLGERLIDRMREGSGKILTFDWASRRPTVHKTVPTRPARSSSGIDGSSIGLGRIL